MMSYLSSQTVSVCIQCPANEVYDFAYDLANFPKWVSFCQSIRLDEESNWLMDTPYCISKVQVADRNTFGVLDHCSIPAPGVEIRDAMRVIPNGDGCEVFLTGFQLPDMSDDKFAQVIQTGLQDLHNLKSYLESQNG